LAALARAEDPNMKAQRLVAGSILALASAALLAQRPAPARHFPAAGAWPSRPAAELGLDQAKLDAAIRFSIENQNQNTKNLAEDIVNTFRNEAPYNTLIGPTQERTGMNGVVIRRGYVAAEWGDTDRADMTFSVTKTFLSTVVGEAYERGLIKDLNDPVASYMPAGVDLFASEHNRKITWDHLLRQTSDWSGTLWDKPDWADRPPRGQTPDQWPNREMHEPGTFYKYNDTRVNALALAALHVLKEPLPAVLKREIMDPIGASNTWHWEGYDNAWVEIDGRRMQSVTGGGHFGGGMFINAWDMARFGYLFLNNGRWGGRQLVTERWMQMARTPGPANRTYGFMNWFLNTPSTGRGGQPTRPLPSAPESSVTFRGNGQNIIYIDWENDLVVVVRWIGRGLDEFIGRVLGSRAAG
jgi:CubicO group peptidase (beta-lactamase class C family)